MSIRCTCCDSRVPESEARDGYCLYCYSVHGVLSEVDARTLIEAEFQAELASPSFL